MPAYKAPLTTVDNWSDNPVYKALIDKIKERANLQTAMGEIGAAGELPGPAGFVINPENAFILSNVLKSMLKGKSTPSEIAKTYLSIKYPKLFSKLGRFQTSKEGELGGDYMRSAYQPDRVIRISSTMPDPVMAIETGGHELSHLIHDVRNTPLPPYIPQRVQVGWGQSHASLEQYAKYFNQPAEVLARRGGKTVQDTFMKLLDVLNTSRTPKTAREILGLE